MGVVGFQFLSALRSGSGFRVRKIDDIKESI